jgi:hypothetical protein
MAAITLDDPPPKRRDGRGRRRVPDSEAAAPFVCEWNTATLDEVADDTCEASTERDRPRRGQTLDAAPSIPGARWLRTTADRSARMRAMQSGRSSDRDAARDV